MLAVVVAHTHKVGGIVEVDVVGLNEVVAHEVLGVLAHALRQHHQVVVVGYLVGVLLGATACKHGRVHCLDGHNLAQGGKLVVAGHEHVAAVHVLQGHLAATDAQAVGFGGKIAIAVDGFPHHAVAGRHGEVVFHFSGGLVVGQLQGRCTQLGCLGGFHALEAGIKPVGVDPVVGAQPVECGLRGHACREQGMSWQAVDIQGCSVASDLHIIVAVEEGGCVAIDLASEVHAVAVDALGRGHAGSEHLARVVAVVEVRLPVAQARWSRDIAHNAAHLLGGLGVHHQVGVVAVAHLGLRGHAHDAASHAHAERVARGLGCDGHDRAGIVASCDGVVDGTAYHAAGIAVAYLVVERACKVALGELAAHLAAHNAAHAAIQRVVEPGDLDACSRVASRHIRVLGISCNTACSTVACQLAAARAIGDAAL